MIRPFATVPLLALGALLLAGCQPAFVPGPQATYGSSYPPTYVQPSYEAPAYSPCGVYGSCYAPEGLRLTPNDLHGGGG